MSPITISVVVFACVFGGAFVGIVIHFFLPKEHLNSDSKDAVRLGMALVGTTVALVRHQRASANEKFRAIRIAGGLRLRRASVCRARRTFGKAFSLLSWLLTGAVLVVLQRLPSVLLNPLLPNKMKWRNWLPLAWVNWMSKV
jgi:hypothetical protein